MNSGDKALTNSVDTYWAIVPAAGVGRRMNAALPKQYLAIAGKPILVHTLEQLLNYPLIKKIIVAISPQDDYWPKLSLANSAKILTVKGGKERAESVLNCLLALKNLAKPHDWILVHDAVRPLLRQEDLDKLVQSLKNHTIGGLLGIPSRDTLKQVDDKHRVVRTIDRLGIWQALTPQMFRYHKLLQALLHVREQGSPVTDEASAIELLGEKPIMIEGSADNIKITYPADLAFAEKYFA